MSQLAIRADGLSKRYSIGAPQDRYKTLRESMMAAPMRPIRAVQSRIRRDSDRTKIASEIWALKDVSFDIEAGEIVGIIGRNGAGKSTLLKVLSRITEPTVGHAEIRGRVGSLLEVGTGFHPELTGRENIFLNGAILGMKRAEIKSRFDEITAFAEIERFLDTPVKRYSTGMHMRLAFSVAAHLEPEILIVDEVLAVGDASFQKKCINKMEDVGRHGRTVIFVSHNMAAISRLCERAVLLEEGRVVLDGSIHQVVGRYISSGHGTNAVREWPNPATAPGDAVARLRAVRVRDMSGLPRDSMDIRNPISVEIEFDVKEPGCRLTPHFIVINDEGIWAFQSFDLSPEWRKRSRPIGRFRCTATIPGNFLTEGGYTIRAVVSTVDPFEIHADVFDAVAFQVTDSLDGDSARGDYGGPMPGIVRPILPWRDECVDGSETSSLRAAALND